MNTDCWQVQELLRKLKNELIDLNRLARSLVDIDRKEFKASNYDRITATVQSSARDLIEKTKIVFVQMQIGRAREILDRPNEMRVLGPEQIEETFGIKIALKDVPNISFTRQELEKAKLLGQMLVLRVDRLNDRRPLSIFNIDGIVTTKWQQQNRGALLDNSGYVNWQEYLGAKNYFESTPRFGWALTSTNVIPESQDKNYLEQTDILVRVLADTIPNKTLSQEYAKAISEFFEQKSRISQLEANRDRYNDISYRLKLDRLVRELYRLKLYQLILPTIQELIYDLAIYFNTNNRYLLKRTVTWTATAPNIQSQLKEHFNGRPVFAGEFDSDGLGVGWWTRGYIDYHHGSHGMVFSCRG